jgi:hypothetical protein
MELELIVAKDIVDEYQTKTKHFSIDILFSNIS